MSKLPALQFYPADWLKDPGVQALDYFEQGVWFTILCRMHESRPRGYLILGGNVPSDEIIARMLRLKIDEWLRVKESLILFGVCSVSVEGCSAAVPAGALYSRRMVRDTEAMESYREAKSKAGKASAESRKHNKNKGLDGKFTKNESKAGTEHMLNSVDDSLKAVTEHNSTLHSSSSSSIYKKELSIESSKETPTRRPGTRLPDDFAVTADMTAWARKNAPNVALALETDKFRDFWAAKPGAGGVKLDWTATWRNWMRNAKERSTGPNGSNNQNRSRWQDVGRNDPNEPDIFEPELCPKCGADVCLGGPSCMVRAERRDTKGAMATQ